MRKKTAIVTDSNSGISQQEAEELGIYVLAMPFMVGETMYYEGRTISREAFYDALRKDVPMSTSQPSLGEVGKLWEDVLAEWEELVYIPMTAALSGSCGSAAALAEEYGGRVQVADNRAISLLQRHSVNEAIALRDRGADAREIKNILESRVGRNRIYLGVESLHHLRRGGRVSPAAAAIGTALQIKPILSIDPEGFQVQAKVRGRKAMLQELLHMLQKDLDGPFQGKDVSLYVAYAGREEDGAAWQEMARAAFAPREVGMNPLPLVIACHTGPDVFGIGLVENLELD